MFKKLNEQVKIQKIKERSLNETDLRDIETEMIFGDLLESNDDLIVENILNEAVLEFTTLINENAEDKIHMNKLTLGSLCWMAALKHRTFLNVFRDQLTGGAMFRPKYRKQALSEVMPLARESKEAMKIFDEIKNLRDNEKGIKRNIKISKLQSKFIKVMGPLIKQNRKTKKTLTEDSIEGGKADKLTVEDIAKKHNVSVEVIEGQIKKGIPIEHEHVGNDKAKAREICMDHLVEFPDYYDRLIKMEEEGKKALKEENLPPMEDREFGLPEVKKYPMFDAEHVKSAAKMFDHGDISPEQRKKLASAIKRQAKKYNVDLSFVGDKNSLKSYLSEMTMSGIAPVIHQTGDHGEDVDIDVEKMNKLNKEENKKD